LAAAGVLAAGPFNYVSQIVVTHFEYFGTDLCTQPTANAQIMVY
jgi:hypothetical protein